MLALEEAGRTAAGALRRGVERFGAQRLVVRRREVGIVGEQEVEDLAPPECCRFHSVQLLMHQRLLRHQLSEKHEPVVDVMLTAVYWSLGHSATALVDHSNQLHEDKCGFI